MKIDVARKLLWSEYDNLSDEEIQRLIDMLKSICSIVVEDYINKY